LDITVQRAQGYMLKIQHEQGYWWGELESNPTMEAEYVMLCHLLGVNNPERKRKIANYILSRQQPDGSWVQYFDAPGNLSTSVECYFALKLCGLSADAAPMMKARQFILSKGGVPQTRIFTRIWLAMLGQYDWKGLPVMPPEMVLLPSWLPFNIYEFSSWARATIVPMCIILTDRPVSPVPPQAAIRELYPVVKEQTKTSLSIPRPTDPWRALFYSADRFLRLYEKAPVKIGRETAKRMAAQWIVEHQEADGSWGGIQPPWVYSLIALKHLGYTLEHPVMNAGLQGFETFAIEEENTWRVQACVSPVWDTCLALTAMLESGMSAESDEMQRPTRWLIARQILRKGDWAVKSPKTPPGGWAFEFANDNYPDVDDVAEVLIALEWARLTGEEDQRRRNAIDLGVRWVFGLQSKNGGWAAFDKDNNRALMSKIPFADFGETLDPPSVDVTAHVLEALGRLGFNKEHPAVAKAYKFIRDEQEEDGSWFGRWGVNYIYGTGAVLPALQAIGEDMTLPYIRKAVDWVKSHQNDDGGWGESCGSYVDFALRGTGPSTPSQTAWALLSLLASCENGSISVARGIEYLCRTQKGDGTWDEPHYTGTGFPGYGVGQRLKRLPKPGEEAYQGLDMENAFMINYHLYRHYWPLTALGRFKRTYKE